MLGLKVKIVVDYMVVMSIMVFTWIAIDRHKKGLADVLSFFDCCPWHAFQ